MKMIRVVFFQNDAPIDHSYCNSSGVMALPAVPRVGEDMMFDGKPVKIINATWMLGEEDYDIRADLVPIPVE
ncbi:hypothetical protein GCM10010082_18210 [Kushneria pakistanensis]|uniref:Uncharacterized protein n=1 Tax=Kushneria pakistanensis TaxID=1508770 RepID=A0ABQ3FID5_9GAMM|nr:hypothetical protein [Kushneria pakistanensis]GHC25614.1 hypothetical protein GCM10010082_18210 [Kushneria pakistanensis]